MTPGWRVRLLPTKLRVTGSPNCPSSSSGKEKTRLKVWLRPLQPRDVGENASGKSCPWYNWSKYKAIGKTLISSLICWSVYFQSVIQWLISDKRLIKQQKKLDLEVRVFAFAPNICPRSKTWQSDAFLFQLNLIFCSRRTTYSTLVFSFVFCLFMGA